MHRGMALLLLLLQRMSPTLEGQPSGWGGVHSGPRASSRPFAPNGRASEAQRMCCLPARPAWLSLRLRGGSSGALAHGHDRAATRAQSRGRGSDPQDDVLDDERATQRARGAGGKRGDDEPPESAQDSSSGRIVGWEAVGAGVKDARELLGLPKKRNWAASDKHVKSKARRRDRNDEPPPAGAGDAAQGEGSAAEGRPDQETSDGGLDLDDSGGANAAEEVLDVDWDPAQEDPYLPPDAAGRRVITEELVQRLIADAGLPLQIETQFDEDPDPLERFNDRPKVFLVGPAHAAQKLSSRLPRGFGVERLNATLSILGRAPSPPPLGRDDSDQDRYRGPLAEEQERWLDSDGAEGTTLDEAYAAGNTTLREYREAMVPRLLKLRRRSEVNDGNGAYELGMRLLYGIGVRKDPMNGCRYVMNAAAQGHCYAQAQLGCCYHEGVGIARDDGKAAKWWKLAATGNSIIPEGVLLAMHNLAVAYAQGIGVKRDYLLACHWHKQVTRPLSIYREHILSIENTYSIYGERVCVCISCYLSLSFFLSRLLSLPLPPPLSSLPPCSAPWRGRWGCDACDTKVDER